MKKLSRFGLVVTIALFATAAFAQVTFDLDYNYYSDGTFTTWVGEQDYDYCSGIITTSGTTSDWRTKDKMNCDTLQGTHVCQQFVNGSWVNITCPPGV